MLLLPLWDVPVHPNHLLDIASKIKYYKINKILQIKQIFIHAAIPPYWIGLCTQILFLVFTSACCYRFDNFPTSFHALPVAF